MRWRVVFLVLPSGISVTDKMARYVFPKLAVFWYWLKKKPTFVGVWFPESPPLLSQRLVNRRDGPIS